MIGNKFISQSFKVWVLTVDISQNKRDNRVKTLDMKFYYRILINHWDIYVQK